MDDPDNVIDQTINEVSNAAPSSVPEISAEGSSFIASRVKCKEGQDEAFDNCVKEDEIISSEEQDLKDMTNDGKGSASAMSSREFASGAMDLVAKVSKKLQFEDDCQCP